jgi:hypothetical protein
MYNVALRFAPPKASVLPSRTRSSSSCPKTRVVARAAESSVDESLDSITQNANPIGTRRVVLAAALLLATPKAAFALGKSAKDLAKESRARREKLKAATQKMKENGKAESAFDDSKFGLGEDATTPNRVNRTGEGGAGI